MNAPPAGGGAIAGRIGAPGQRQEAYSTIRRGVRLGRASPFTAARHSRYVAMIFSCDHRGDDSASRLTPSALATINESSQATASGVSAISSPVKCHLMAGRWLGADKSGRADVDD